ncbi:hypothetical protein ACFLQV_00235 [Calditrichota bacterium]
MDMLELPLEAGYDCKYLYVCFNDDCPYFKGGWNWMWDHYRVKSSYRMRINPDTGSEAPLPVWSKDALKNFIIDD